MNAEAQKTLLDVLSQHQAYLFRASSQNVNDLIKVFGQLSNEQLLKLSELFEDLTDSERKALRGLNFLSKSKSSSNIAEIKTILNEWFSSLNSELLPIFEQSAVALAVYEAGYTIKLMGEKLTVDGEKIYQKAKKSPFSGGQLVDYLFSDISASLRKKVEYTIRDGFSSGQTNQQIIQRIKGKKTKVNGETTYVGGLLESERHVIERQVRTARSHVGNAAYIDTYKALGYEYVKVVATLDGRTCKYCASIDGKVFHIDDPSRPRFPVHPNNRTTYVGCDKGGVVAGKRPFVADSRSVKDIPKDQRDGKIGRVDANTSFKSWFDDQDDGFKRKWLGKSKYELYTKGEYSLDKFADPLSKRGYTLKELKALDEETFEAVGL